MEKIKKRQQQGKKHLNFLKLEIKCSLTIIFWGYFNQIAKPLCMIAEGAGFSVKQVPH